MDKTRFNKEFVKRHFEAINRREIQTIIGNMRPDLYDHELDGDHKSDIKDGAQRLQAFMQRVPDLKVDVLDVVADDDLVVVRAIWFGTDSENKRKVGFRGFVQWKVIDGKLAERWATVTPLAELDSSTQVW